jgi:hypothetical protein
MANDCCRGNRMNVRALSTWAMWVHDKDLFHQQHTGGCHLILTDNAIWGHQEDVWKYCHSPPSAVLSQSLIGLRAAMSLALPARWCYQSSRDWCHQTI